MFGAEPMALQTPMLVCALQDRCWASWAAKFLQKKGRPSLGGGLESVGVLELTYTTTDPNGYFTPFALLYSTHQEQRKTEPRCTVLKMNGAFGLKYSFRQNFYKEERLKLRSL